MSRGSMGTGVVACLLVNWLVALNSVRVVQTTTSVGSRCLVLSDLTCGVPPRPLTRLRTSNGLLVRSVEVNSNRYSESYWEAYSACPRVGYGGHRFVHDLSPFEATRASAYWRVYLLVDLVRSGIGSGRPYNRGCDTRHDMTYPALELTGIVHRYDAPTSGWYFVVDRLRRRSLLEGT